MIDANFKYRNRLLFAFLIVFVPLILISSTIAYYQVKKILQTNIEKELQDTTLSLLNLIQTSAALSIKNRLHAIADKNLDIARYYYGKYQSGLLSRSEAITIIEEIFLSQSVGMKGYIYCINSQGIITVHPNEKIRNKNFSELDFIRQQIQIKKGYFEYDIKKDGESNKQSKALYMVYFEPLDWIISASSYREEFSSFLNIDDFRNSILSFKSGETGYAFVLSEDGDILVHPTMQGINLLRQSAYSNEFFKQIIKEKNGKIRYFWKNPNELKPREKITIFKYLPEYKWIVASSSYVDEVFSPLNTFRNFLVVFMILILLSSVWITYLISTSVTKPLVSLMDTLDQGARGDFSVRMDDDVPYEFGRLARQFNSFMGQLEQNQEKIKTEIQKNTEARAVIEEYDLRLRSLFNQSFQFTGLLSPLGMLEEVNQSSLDFVGYTAGDVMGKPFWQTPWWRHDPKVQQQVKDAVERAAQGDFIRFEITNTSKDDQIINMDVTIKPVLNSLGDVAFLIVEGRDITAYKLAAQEAKTLAVRLEKAQKMEAIGTLAGGIAHDFNNILSGILGYSELAQLNLDSPEKAKKYIELIVKGAQRAASLTRQILTFSRQSQTEPEKYPLNLYLVVKEALKLLRSSIPTSIKISENIVSKAKVLADSVQMHQLIMNLCTNAYHAMGENKGVLTVQLQEVKISKDKDVFDHIITKGRYLELEIADTGLGMDEKILLKAFDPYFTTKEVGKGTGFGLSMVHAIVESHGGYIKVESAEGKGTSFYIYLPLIDQETDFDFCGKEEKILKRGVEKIMIVDDEENIRLIGQAFLTSCGYSVDTFENGIKAFEAFEKDHDQFDLIVTDMTMPGMTGDELAKRVLKLRKDMPVILCTGYSETVSEEKALEMGIRKYVQKPVSNKDLAVLIREILDLKV
ncbi:cache domain-containing protein [Desulfobacula toluolica]|uniref:histidine kinase n=1 Tax=Desulfobacula toluolica (strain DSM 7467 / Tol2) TaxID=651182 RepID=K0N855_DESTT|nr:cache domain-containing protein [Desulfobacula toluolica]CCK80079.1 two component system sensor histidine kinase, hybrid [Desulfobacula toluolica Tol2]